MSSIQKKSTQTFRKISSLANTVCVCVVSNGTVVAINDASAFCNKPGYEEVIGT